MMVVHIWARTNSSKWKVKREKFNDLPLPFFPSTLAAAAAAIAALTIFIYLMCFKFKRIYLYICGNVCSACTFPHYVSTIFHNDLMPCWPSFPQLNSMLMIASITFISPFHILFASNFWKFDLTIVQPAIFVVKWNYETDNGNTEVYTQNTVYVYYTFGCSVSSTKKDREFLDAPLFDWFEI